MEALLVTQLVFEACDSPSLQTELTQGAEEFAYDRNLSPAITASVAAALQQDVNAKALIWV